MQRINPTENEKIQKYKFEIILNVRSKRFVKNSLCINQPANESRGVKKQQETMQLL